MNQRIDPHAAFDKRRLFLLSVIALTTTGIGFSIRGNIASELQATVFDPMDKLHSAEMVATALRVVFLGYAFTIAIGSPLLYFIGFHWNGAPAANFRALLLYWNGARRLLPKAAGDADFVFNEVLTYASQYSFRVVAILRAILLVVFGAVWLCDKAKGGYKPVKIVPAEHRAS